MPALRMPDIFRRPFFEDKGRAFWRLQAIGWSGYMVLRSVASISNGATWEVVIQAIVP